MYYAYFPTYLQIMNFEKNYFTKTAVNHALNRYLFDWVYIGLFMICA